MKKTCSPAKIGDQYHLDEDEVAADGRDYPAGDYEVIGVDSAWVAVRSRRSAEHPWNFFTFRLANFEGVMHAKLPLC